MSQHADKDTKTPPATYHHGDLRSALIAEAQKIIERDGPAKVSLRGVAKAAGVSSAAPYHHFKDKQALLAAVAANGFRAFTRTMIDRGAPAATAEERLQLLGVGYVEYAVRHAQLFRLMQGPAFEGIDPKSDFCQARKESAVPLINAVSACLPGATQGQIKKACAGAWSMVHGMAVLCNDGRLSYMIDINDLEAAALSITRQLNVTSVLSGDATV